MKTNKISLEILANMPTVLSDTMDNAEAKTQNENNTLGVSFMQPEVFALGETKVIPFSFSGQPIKFEVLGVPHGWTTSLPRINEIGGSIAITASSFSLDPNNKLAVVITDGNSSTKNVIKLSLNLSTIPAGTVCYENGKPIGIVFRPKTKHRNGLIVHKLHATASWGLQPAATYAIDRDNGLNNTMCIEAIDSSLDDFPSFGWCRSHGQHWYMPSLHELISLYHSKAEVNSRMYEINGVPLVTDGAAYWASNEVNNRFAWSLYFQDGHLNYHKKEYTKLVRAVRAF